MPRFRPLVARNQGPGGPVRLASVRALLDELFNPANFFLPEGWRLVGRARAVEETPWEIFHGRLLDGSQTRRRQAFETWAVDRLADGAGQAEPMIGARLDPDAQQVHITRAIHCHTWEGYHAGDGVYLSREVQKWISELVGSINLDRFFDLDELRDELVCRLFHAVVGNSRLPLTSVEAPLPAFSMGQLGYFHRPAHVASAPPLASFRELIAQAVHADLAWIEQVKLLELVLRSVGPNDVPSAAESFAARWKALGRSKQDMLLLLRALFNEVALSPYTSFVDRALEFAHELTEAGHITTNDLSDFLGYLLCSLGRHLTAYDLTTFHHRGANYPDALLLDATLRAYLRLLERAPALFLPERGRPAEDNLKRLRRRALRQGWLVRLSLVGLPVPEVPTSPGENARIMPPPHVRVPEEHIFEPGQRPQRLFAGEMLWIGDRAQEALRESLRDLRNPLELQELGTAIFLERPLGWWKQPGEPDQTPLLSYVAFSRTIASVRLGRLAQEMSLPADDNWHAACQESLAHLPPFGVCLPPRQSPSRPEAVSLDDARRVADDFAILRTTRSSAADFVRLFDWTPLGERFVVEGITSGLPALILAPPDREGFLEIYDAGRRKRLDLRIRGEQGYECRAGVEFPRSGLQVVRVWEEEGRGWREHYIEEELVLLPRGRQR